MARFIIVGGGISGLATAASLARRGHEAMVLEAHDEFTELGAGIQLGPNAFAALDALGVGDDVRNRAVFVDELRLMDGTSDTKITSIPLANEFRNRFGNPYAVVHRIDLYAPLLDACRAQPAVELRTAARVTEYSQTDTAVTAHLAGGGTITGDALIGADGINSTIRRDVVGDGPPRVSGHTIYRSVIPMEHVPDDLRWNAVTLWAGPRWHFVHYPIAEGKQLNLAATRDDGATRAVAGEPVDKALVLSLFPGLSPTPGRLLQLGERWRTWVLSDRDPVSTWSDGRVLLVGDAAHPMLQYAAQGACQALEDAVVLGAMADEDDIPAVFEAFALRRRGRTARAQLLARWLGRRFYHPSGRVAAARDARLSALRPEDHYDRVDWLYGVGDW